jgi:hypothetical protein
LLLNNDFRAIHRILMPATRSRMGVLESLPVKRQPFGFRAFLRLPSQQRINWKVRLCPKQHVVLGISLGGVRRHFVSIHQLWQVFRQPPLLVRWVQSLTCGWNREFLNLCTPYNLQSSAVTGCAKFCCDSKFLHWSECSLCGTSYLRNNSFKRTLAWYPLSDPVWETLG